MGARLVLIHGVDGSWEDDVTVAFAEGTAG